MGRRYDGVKLPELKHERNMLWLKLELVGEAITKANKRKMVRCLGRDARSGCGKLSAIRYLEYRQMHWYVPPSGCTDGDYWRPEGEQFRCPKCGEINRLEDRPEIRALRPFFNKVVNIYDD